MAARGFGSSSMAGGQGHRQPDDTDPNVTDLLRDLHLSAEEGEMAAFSDDEDGGGKMTVEWALIGKVLSPATLHANTILGAMRPAWGNPPGLAIRSVGEKGENLFVAEFGCRQAWERALDAAPWLVGKHAVILKPYDESLKPSDVCFDRMDMWVRIANLPLGWMNAHRGERAMGLIGEVTKMDVDAAGKASGPFLRGRVSINIAKPLRRGVLLQTGKNKPPEWFGLLYEKLPFFCKSCGIMGHSELECDHPAVRNAQGKLPFDIQLRAPEERKKKIQSFAQAAAESFGSGSSSSTAQPRRSGDNNEGRIPREGGGRSSVRASDTQRPPEKRPGEEEEALSPAEQVKKKNGKGAASGEVNRQLFQAMKGVEQQVPRKRKAKGSGSVLAAPDLNLPVIDTSALVPSGVVKNCVSRLVGGQEHGEVSDDSLKKQRMSHLHDDARSAAAASGSPRRAQ